MHHSRKIGLALQTLRRKRGITSVILAKKAGISQAKLSKIENGAVQTLKPADVDRILDILDAPQDIRTQVRFAAAATDSGLAHRYHVQYEWGQVLEVEKATRHLRLFSFSVPTLLQTLEWRLAVLGRFFISDADTKKAMQSILERQDLLWDKNHKFSFVLLESGLYTRLLGRAGHLMQLDRIERLAGLSNISIGIVPYRNGVAASDLSTFILYDDNRVRNCIPGADLESTDLQTVLTHQKIFAGLERVAAYGDEARALVRSAQDYLRKGYAGTGAEV